LIKSKRAKMSRTSVKRALETLGQVPQTKTLKPRPQRRSNFRDEFLLPQGVHVNWFPGHMAKSLRLLKSKFLPRSHLILEVRDSRVPISSVNTKLEELIADSKKPRIIVYNKYDLLHIHDRRKLRRYADLMYPDQTVVYSDGRHKSSTHHIMQAILQRRTMRWDSLATVVCILGMPNAGKSTIINVLRKGQFHGKGQAVGPTAGVTRSINLLKVHSDPLISILDSPGIFIPAMSMDNVEEGLKLGLVGSVPEFTLNPVDVADYLLFRLNKRKLFEYKRVCGLNHPTDDINFLLQKLSEVKRMTDSSNNMNAYWTAEYFLRLWRDCVLPSFLLDDLDPVISELEVHHQRNERRKVRKLQKQETVDSSALAEMESIWAQDSDEIMEIDDKALFQNEAQE